MVESSGKCGDTARTWSVWRFNERNGKKVCVRQMLLIMSERNCTFKLAVEKV